MLVEAYRLGLFVPSLPEDPDCFDRLLRAELIGCLGEADAAHVLHSVTQGHRAVLLARHHDLAAADRLLAEGRDGPTKADRSVANLAKLTFAEAQSAYLSARHGRVEEALNRLGRSFELDLVLEQTGLPVLRMHRVQLVCNLARLHRYRGAEALALNTECALLDHLETGCSQGLLQLPGVFSHGWEAGFDGQKLELVRVMHRQVAASVVNSVARQRQVGSEPLGPLLDALDTRSRVERSQFTAWARLQVALMSGDLACCLTRAVPILLGGRRPSAPLWASAAADVRGLIDACIGAGSG